MTKLGKKANAGDEAASPEPSLVNTSARTDGPKAIELRRYLRQLDIKLAEFAGHCVRALYLKGLTPYEFICKWWTIEPERFKLDPLHQRPGTKHLGWN